MARKKPIEDLAPQHQNQLRWLEDFMEQLAAHLYKTGQEDAAFGMPFYDVQDKLAKLVGLPDDYLDFMELDMDPRVVME